MITSIEIFKQNFIRIKDRGTERSYYPVLTNFIKDYAAELKNKDIDATAEEKAKVENKEIGFPDITVRQKERLVGWIEVKLPDDSLDNPKFYKQFEKYKDALENILFTNFKQWQLWQWAEEGKPTKIKEISFNIADYSKGEEQKLADIFQVFISGKAFEARTTKQLALALAKKTRLLSNQVEEAFSGADETSDLVELKATFEKTLIQDISPHQFANMIAETVAYSLFLASLEHIKRGKKDRLTLTTAIDYLPANIPILIDLYDLINKVSRSLPNIHHAAVALIEQLNAAEMAKIELKLREHKIGEDPVIHFYEPFLIEYDPREREARGVYYTPKPVVDYIVRSVDHILMIKYKKENGLADESIHLLDPATGTGTFLMSAMQQIHSLLQKENAALGQEMIIKEFNRVMTDHILKHFYGFELLIAPYAIAHLKLTLEAERLGFSFAAASDDNGKDKKRFKVYLANTLDDPSKPPQKLFGFESIPIESENARNVKKNAPILVIIGNPPYSGISQNPVEHILYENGKKKKVKTWIGDLIEDYKYVEGNRNTGKHFNERKHWLGDDYVKFIRFGQWKIDENGEGILAMITNHSYLDNPTFRGMRWQLMNSFDEIYIFNLHGNSKTERKTPNGIGDENVFSQIQQGVAISIFIKKQSKKERTCQVFYSDLWGSKNDKYAYLMENGFSTNNWEPIKPNTPYYFFVPRTEKNLDEYSKYSKITDIFPLNVTGIVTARDEFVIDYDKKNLLSRINEFCDLTHSDDYVRSKYFGNKKSDKYLSGDTRGWKMSEARKNIGKENHINNIKNVLYRPFDVRSIYYHPKMVDWGREKVMTHLLKENNLGLVTCRQSSSNTWMHAFITNRLVDDSMVSNKTKERGYCLPLYIHSESTQPNLLAQESRKPNLSSDFIKKCFEKLGFKFISEGRGDLEKTFGPESVFYYAYAIFHSPTYRSRYAEQLKIDFPRLPLTSDKKLFAQLVALGNELVNLHLLGENPFDKSKTIFDETEKWGVKIGGEKPVNCKDWQVTDVRYEENNNRIYVNPGQYFEGVAREVWEFMIGGYQVCDKWLKERKKAERCLSLDDLKHYMKIIIAMRETIRIMNEIDKIIPKWPME